MVLPPIRVHPSDIVSVTPESPVPASGSAEPAAEESLRLAPSYISPSMKVEGTITADEDLYIDGFVEGSLSLSGNRLTVGEMAYIDAETIAREVVVFGAVQGDVSASDRIEIKKRASVAGDLATAEIVIEQGAHFKGRIKALGTAP